MFALFCFGALEIAFCLEVVCDVLSHRAALNHPNSLNSTGQNAIPVMETAVVWTLGKVSDAHYPFGCLLGFAELRYHLALAILSRRPSETEGAPSRGRNVRVHLSLH
ncbi:hypothetical protein BJY01DRAFT_213278, partial [Aspergillus pseudoustus]